MAQPNTGGDSSPWWKNLAKDFLDPSMDDRRIFRRIQAFFPLRIYDIMERREASGHVINLSAKGVGLVVDQPLKPDTALDMWLGIPDGHEPLYLQGRVAWQEPQGYDQYRVGVKFNRINFMGVSRALRA